MLQDVAGNMAIWQYAKDACEKLSAEISHCLACAATGLNLAWLRSELPTVSDFQPAPSAKHDMEHIAVYSS